MKRFFSLGVAAVVTSSLIMGGCSDGSENLPTAATDALEEEAEWVRVDLKLSSEHPMRTIKMRTGSFKPLKSPGHPSAFQRI